MLDAADSRGAGLALLWDSCGAGVLVWLWGGFGVCWCGVGVLLWFWYGFGVCVGVLRVTCRCDAGVVDRGERVAEAVWSWCGARVVLVCSRGFGKVLVRSLCMLLCGAGVLWFEV